MRHISCVILLAAAYGCGAESRITQPEAALAGLAQETQYEVVKYGSLGGTLSRGMAINEAGTVAGWSTLVDGSRRAVRWQGLTPVSLGTLGGEGTSSMVPWPGQNNSGMIVGISHTDAVDPLGEDWSCEFGGFLPETDNLTCRGFVWENGVMRELPTFGGQHGFATGVNDRGEVVGWAETTVLDPTCDLSTTQRRQFRAAIWYPKDGSKGKIKIRELPPFGNDATSAATAINNNGQAVGISGRCDQAVGRFSAQHAVLWEKNGTVREIPNLGGTTWHTPMHLNDQGDVVGFSNPESDDDLAGGFNGQAFLWSYGAAEATNLGTLDGDPLSQAFAINSNGQVVGISFGDAVRGARAFLYEDGVLKNLNDLIESDDVFLSAQDINDAGQITGRLLDGVTGETLMFVATPIN
jgi:probable HAF family extracellular repeat protein